ncbi:hypothetical protein M8C21_020473 [Ambrosia artemisiifolia]|uniref:50S ribosomal protein L18 n=1 Tax=Ambrosia artemisiifolia TaxID=4212 RepID=A0AAD5GM25_AMBAR|nr:hypothetical protein M8C21_020473 [Ambrosia artemisiifolia]
MLWTKPPKLLCNSTLVFDSPLIGDFTLAPLVQAHKLPHTYPLVRARLLLKYPTSFFLATFDKVIHAPTATVAAAASSQEKALREAWTKSQQSTRDVSAAAKIGKILGERLLVNDIPAVSVVYKKNQRYHGKVRAVIDSLREAGVKLL